MNDNQMDLTELQAIEMAQRVEKLQNQLRRIREIEDFKNGDIQKVLIL